MTIEERLESLERRLDALDKGKVEDLRAGQFTLVDASGKPRASLRIRKGEPGLVLFDDAGLPRAVLHITKDGAGLVLLDENGKPRVGLDVTKDGPRVEMGDEKTQVIWSAP